MKTFDQLMAETPGAGQRAILLGNGFSRAWNSRIFDYQNLLSQADFGARDAHIRNIFNELGTYCFEEVACKLRAASALLRSYGSHDGLVGMLESDLDLLKKALSGAIVETHPARPDEVSEQEFRTVRQFLSQFGHIFTVNYDLLMFWTKKQVDLEPATFPTRDGFRGHGVWQGLDRHQQIFFLHGGLHMYDTPACVKKHVYIRNDRFSIIDQINRNLDQNIFPLIVSEPTSAKKLERILHNQYLSYCYHSLRERSGALFVYGHAFGEADRHIFEQVRDGRFSRVLISLHGDPESAVNRATRANALEFLDDGRLEIEFFPAESASVWQEQSSAAELTPA